MFVCLLLICKISEKEVRHHLGIGKITTAALCDSGWLNDYPVAVVPSAGFVRVVKSGSLLSSQSNGQSHYELLD